jgi:uncharacterized membrane protein YgcG
MHTVRRFLVTILVPALIVSIFAVGAAAAHGSDGKVSLCHWASHKFVKITVSLNAKPAHLKQGDVDPDEYGDCSGDHEGDHEGNHQGNDGDSHNCQGARAKSSHVRFDSGSSGKGGGSQRSAGNGDKA